jgi:hypothetical protein
VVTVGFDPRTVQPVVAIPTELPGPLVSGGSGAKTTRGEGGEDSDADIYTQDRPLPMGQPGQSEQLAPPPPLGTLKFAKKN